MPISQVSDYSDNDSEISKFHHDLMAMENYKINFKKGSSSANLPSSKYYYPRPTTQDILFKEDTQC